MMMDAEDFRFVAIRLLALQLAEAVEGINQLLRFYNAQEEKNPEKVIEWDAVCEFRGRQFKIYKTIRNQLIRLMVEDEEEGGDDDQWLREILPAELRKRLAEVCDDDWHTRHEPNSCCEKCGEFCPIRTQQPADAKPETQTV